jgi:ABC-type transporter Mla MlaB component
MINRKLVMILSIFVLALFMGSMVAAESGTGSNSGSTDEVEIKTLDNGKAMKESKSEIKIKFSERLDGTERSELRIRFANASDDDLRRLQIARIDASDLERLDAAGRARLLSELRVRIKDDDVSRFREVEVRIKERGNRVSAIRDARGIADARLSAIARLRLLESELDGEALTRVAAIRTKLETSSITTVAVGDVTLIDEEIRIRHRENARERGTAAVAKAEAILEKLQNFTARIEAKMAESDVALPRAENVVVRLNGLEADLADSITTTKAAWTAVQEEDATRTEIQTLHRELIQLRVNARHAVSAMHALIQAFKDRPAGSDDIRVEDETSLVEITAVTEVEVESEVNDVLLETTESSDDSDLETDDSGNDSDSDINDSDEDDGSETDDSGNDSESDLNDSDEDNGGDDE